MHNYFGLEEAAKGTYDLAQVLNRGGVSHYWNFSKNVYVTESRYIDRFSVSAVTQEESLQAYGAKFQEPQNWKQLSLEFFGKIPGFSDNLNGWTDIDIPMTFWNEVLIHTFRKAYDEPKDLDTINRVYAFADWCNWQDQPDENNPGEHHPTTMCICFLEYMPLIPAALADLPNWYSYSEIEWLINSPFMVEDKKDYLRVYEK